MSVVDWWGYRLEREMLTLWRLAPGGRVVHWAEPSSAAVVPVVILSVELSPSAVLASVPAKLPGSCSTSVGRCPHRPP